MSVEMESGQSAYVYVMVNRSHQGWVKVGYTDRDVEQRRVELSGATGVLHPFTIAHVFRVPAGAGPDAEQLAHAALSRFKRRKEFFCCNPNEAAHEVGPALAKLASVSAIDVHSAKAKVETAWREKTAAYADLSHARHVHASARADVDRTQAERRRTLEANIRQQYCSLLWQNNVMYWGSAGLKLLISAAVGGPVVAMLALCPGCLFWGPALAKEFPTTAIELSQFEHLAAAIRKEYEDALAKLETTAKVTELRLLERAHRLSDQQRVGENTLRSFDLSPKFMDRPRRLSGARRNEGGVRWAKN